MAGNRKQLRDLRRRKDEADNAFMGLARRLIASSHRTELDALSTPLQIRFQEMQLLRTDYHTKETEYEGLEVDLDQLEEDSNRLEIRFFRTLAMADITTDNTKGHHLQAKAEAQDSVGMRSMLMGILPDRPSVEVHPLWTDLSDAIAEMNIAQEEVEDILLARQELTYDLGLKERTNRTVSARELELLRSFRADEQAELARLAEATTRVRELYNRCMAEAAPHEDPPYHIAFALGLQTDDEIILDDSTSDTEENFFYRRYPALLSQPHHLLGREPLTVLSNLKQVAKSPMNTVDRGDQMRAAFKEYEISHLLRDTKAMNKTDYINRWLLQYLRISPLQVEILAAAFTESTHLQIVDTQRWELDVLFQWWRDEAAIRSVEHISQCALTATVASSAHGPKDGLLFLGSSHSSQIRGMASEPPNSTFAKHDIWESRSPRERAMREAGELQWAA
ncbi:predicted protein [Verticillium alfalfae VaMs.102]|uniref:Predicted protein n=1 Tax=Verticillium alfalfae (strain VaMs.102 / ATCC MYA-4576 / FGSC 10136) TaxID=526221 RepID=C9SXC9_VERA1|nr:predicted protein [Verticillium alfalfae VaMs.102]EEY23319.1 predicted protein [Verticillium alfalfae VaMs.102]